MSSPRVARWLLRVCLPASARHAATNDLDEEFRRFVRPARGNARARLWYWRQVLASVIPALAMRLRPLRSVPGDVRHGVRLLAARPGFTIAATLVLAVGIGSASAILSVIEGVLIKPLAYERPDRLVVILHQGRNPVAPANFVDWRTQTTSFAAMGAAEYWTPTLNGGDEPDRVTALRMTFDVFPMLGVAPALGRTWTAAEETSGDAHVAVIAHQLWQRRFGGDRGVIGRHVTLDGQPYTVIGVMPDTFVFAPFWATKSELWAPLALGPRAAVRAGGSLRVFARLKDGVTLERARLDVASAAERLNRQFPGSNRDVRVIDLTEKVVGDVRTPLVLLLGAVGFVLLLACANVAHLLLAHASTRDREIAVRAALGATRGRLVRQLLTESLVLAIAGGLLGLLLARAGIQLLTTIGAASLPRSTSIALDGWALAATAAITIAAGVVFGLLPARRAARHDLTSSLKEGERSIGDGRGRLVMRRLVIASEIALALMLLVGAGLLGRSFLALEQRDLGFDPGGVLTMIVPVSGTAESAPGRREAFYRNVLERVGRIPGVRSAAGVNHIPIGGDSWGWPFRVDGRPEPKPGDAPVASYKVVMPGYFKTMGMTMLRGRDVDDRDRVGSPGVVVVNQFLANEFWPGADPLGRRIAFDRDAAGQSIWLTVIGVVRDTIHGDWASPAEEEVYLPMLQHRDYLTSPQPHFAYLSVVVRSACSGAGCDAAAIAPAVREAVHALDPTVPVTDVWTMDDLVAEAGALQRFYLVLLTAFAVSAVLLAAIGVYGVISSAVSRRTREIGLRLALGATPSGVLRGIVLGGMATAAIGIGAGAAGAASLSGAISTLLFGVGPMDLGTYAAVSAILAIVALVACYIPARRAARIDPLRALKDS